MNDNENNNGWITDRVPGEEFKRKHVAIPSESSHKGWAYCLTKNIKKGSPWQPVPRLGPYRKPILDINGEPVPDWVLNSDLPEEPFEYCGFGFNGRCPAGHFTISKAGQSGGWSFEKNGEFNRYGILYYLRRTVRDDGTPIEIPELPEVKGGWKIEYRGKGWDPEDERYFTFIEDGSENWSTFNIYTKTTPLGDENIHYAELIPPSFTPYTQDTFPKDAKLIRLKEQPGVWHKIMSISDDDVTFGRRGNATYAEIAEDYEIFVDGDWQPAHQGGGAA